MEISNHVKTMVSIRGDYKRKASNAWREGVKVRLPNYTYGNARLDRETGTILLSDMGMVKTAIRRYPHLEVEPLDSVFCSNCGEDFQGRPTCPSCGTDEW